MSYRKLIYTTCLIVILVITWVILKNNSSTSNIAIERQIKPEITIPSVERTVKQSPPTYQNINKIEPQVFDQTKATIILNVGNFESLVNGCFQGDKCELTDDPKTLYMYFKKSGNNDANDSLVSFLRSKLKDSQYRDKYKNILKQMIDDLYSSEEKQFQEAAYYNYLGDLQKSLDIYLDLERKIDRGDVLRPAPKLNIANTYYDMKRFRESLPYYQAALNEYISRQQEASVPSQNEMIRFIEDRVEDIQRRL